MIKKYKLKRRLIAFLASMHFYGNPTKGIKVVGVTGTNGKTTVATLLYRVALILGYKAGVIGTTGAFINGEEFKPEYKILTTPGPLDLIKIFKEMKAAGCQYVFMEVSSHAMHQGRVNGIKFEGGIFTNLTHDHLDYHKSFSNYFLAKKKFFQKLPRSAFALANADSRHGRRMLEGIKAQPFFYGFDENRKDNEFFGEILNMDANGLELLLDNKKIKPKLLGEFNAYNIFAVFAAASLLGFDPEKTLHILENMEPPTGRFEHVASGTGITGIVDYAHTPDALENVLKTAEKIKKEGRIITVVGCSGDRDPTKRSPMGKIATSYSDEVIFTMDNPRSEDPEKIIADMQVDMNKDEKEKVSVIIDRAEAVMQAVKKAQKGDIVLLAGKGHEAYQEIKGEKVKHPTDMELLREAFGE